MNRFDEARIIEKDATLGSIRYRQYLAWLNRNSRPLADFMIKHSANVLNDHRDRISRGDLYLFEGRPVMAGETP